MENDDLIFLLDFDENLEDSGMSALSFVRDPATQIVWEKFEQEEFQETYTDYPKAASENACKVLKWIDEYGRDEVDGMTRVGLQRANQLCKGRPISIETIARMASFKRHQENSEIDPKYKGKPWKDKGYVAWLAWGGDEGIDYAIRKLEIINNRLRASRFEIMDEEKRMVQSPIMIPDTNILRFSKTIGKYYVKFTKDTIEKMMLKYFKDNKNNIVNLNHNPEQFVNDVYMVESYIVNDKNKSLKFEDVPQGTWIATYYVGNDEVWDKIRNNEFSGFSLEGGFFQELEEQTVEKIYNKIKQVLENDLPDEEKELIIKELLRIK